MTPYSSTVHLETLGCKLNFAEGASIAQSLIERGFQMATSAQPASYYIINTCSVTENADSKCRKLIRDFRQHSPSAKVVIIGCYAQLKPAQIQAIQGVDLVLGAHEKYKLPDFLAAIETNQAISPVYESIETLSSFHPSHSTGERTRSFLKVQDGCDYSCTFCTIPLARGKSRNGTIASVVVQAKKLASAGIREIVLTGVNLGDFGKSTGESFHGLIQALEEIESMTRFRISSIEPNLLTSAVLDTIAHSHRFMPHFHVPLQSGSDRILGAMRRRYRADFYRDKIHEIRSLLPWAGIGVDVIVGFPGENDHEFTQTHNFLNDLPISYLHVFSYSEREGTLAMALVDKVSKEKKSQRSRVLHGLSNQKQQHFISEHRGKRYPVLFERAPAEGLMQGYTPNYIKITEPFRPECINEIVDLTLDLFNTGANVINVTNVTKVTNVAVGAAILSPVLTAL